MGLAKTEENCRHCLGTAIPRRFPDKKGGAQRPLWENSFQQRKLWQFQHPLVLRSMDFWGHEHLQQVRAAQTLRQHNELGFHKLIELCKQITHSQDKQSPAKTQPPLGPQEKWAWLCFVNYYILCCPTGKRAGSSLCCSHQGKSFLEVPFYWSDSKCV